MNNTELRWLGCTLVEQSRIKLCLSRIWPLRKHLEVVKYTSQKLCK